MTGQELTDALRSGRRAYGTLIVSTSPRWVQPVKSLGLDFVFIDTEHIPIDRERLSWMCRAYNEAGLAPIVRIPAPDPDAATQALDGGAAGVVAPYVETVAQVKRLVGAVKYRPLKGKRLEALLSESDGIGEGLRDYLRRYNEGQPLIVNVESVPALETLDDILSVPELDAVLVGPHDLSCSMEMPEEYLKDEFVEVVEEIIAKARARGKGAGIHMVYREGKEQEIRLARGGANLILHSADVMIFREAMHDDLVNLRSALGDTSGGRGDHGIHV